MVGLSQANKMRFAFKRLLASFMVANVKVARFADVNFSAAGN